MSDYVPGDEWYEPGEDIGFGQGYHPPQRPPGPVYTRPTYQPAETVSANIQLTPGENYQGTVYSPPVEVIETPAYTEYQMRQLLNKGWNSWARSINEIPVGGFVSITVATGVSGACLAVGPAGKDGSPLADFSHSLIIDAQGIKVQERGVSGRILLGSQTESTAIRVFRMVDNSVVYAVTTGKKTVVHLSATKLPFLRSFPAYAYAYLYSSGDAVASAILVPDVTVQFGRA